MDFFNAIIITVLIVFGTALGGLLLWKIFDMIRNSVGSDKASYNKDEFDRLAKAFIEHRKDTDRRLQDIKAIITDGEPDTNASKNRLNERSKQQRIDVEADKSEDQQEPGSGNLNNMLDKKRTT